MPTTRDDIRGWLNRAKTEGATHMLVVCDTYDWTDYPVSVKPGQDVREIAKQHSGPNMTKLMEVYHLGMDIEAQLLEGRAHNYDLPLTSAHEGHTPVRTLARPAMVELTPNELRLIVSAPDLAGQHESNIVDLEFLRRAIAAGDPAAELLLRVDDLIRHSRTALNKALGKE